MVSTYLGGHQFINDFLNQHEVLANFMKVLFVINDIEISTVRVVFGAAFARLLLILRSAPY